MKFSLIELAVIKNLCIKRLVVISKFNDINLLEDEIYLNSILNKINCIIKMGELQNVK